MKRLFSMLLCLALVGAASVGVSTVLADQGGGGGSDDNGTAAAPACVATTVTAPNAPASKNDEVGDDNDNHHAGRYDPASGPGRLLVGRP